MRSLLCASIVLLTAGLAAAATTYNALLEEHVTDDGFVRYDDLAADRASLDAYVSDLATVDLASLDEDERLATLINAYNAFMLQTILDHRPVEKVTDIDGVFKAERFILAGEPVSLDEVEHEMIRKHYDEPRIHWAVNCAATSCPPLRAEAYEGDRLDEQLADQTRRVHNDAKFVDYDGGDTIRLTGLYGYYADDFKRGNDSVLPYVAQFVPALKKRLDDGTPPTIEYKAYDWTPNDAASRQE